MTENIEKYIEAYFEHYQDITTRYYPAHKNNGFTEQNMTVRFASVVEKNCEGAFTWYEAPIFDSNQKCTQHMDAVIFDQAGNNIFLVESKRLSNRTKKIENLGEDINRMHKSEVRSTVSKGLKNKQDSPTVYGVILADVWPDPKGRKREEIYKSWEKETFLKDNRKDLKLKYSISPVCYKHITYWLKDDINEYKHALLVLVFKVAEE